MTQLTTRQSEVMQAIVQYVKSKNYSPSVRELGELINCKSSSTVHDFLVQLKRKGYIDFEPSKPRTIRIIKM